LERQSSDHLVSVVVPAYNEAAHLYENLDTLWSHLDTTPFTWDIVVVDDGSTDGTGAEARRFAHEHDRVTVMGHVANLGLGQGLKTGFRHARGTYVVAFDADLSYSPDHIDRLITTITSTGAKIVVASPYAKDGSVEGVPTVRALMSRVANRLLKILSISQVATITGMVRAYDREFINGLSLKSVDNQINAEIIYKAGLLRQPVLEIPAHLVWTRDEEETRSRGKSFSVIKTTLDFLFSGFIFRPFMFFVLPGALLGLLAIYSLGWAIYHVITYLPEQSGSLDSIISGAVGEAFGQSPQTFVIGGIALIFAFQLISLGILSAQNKRYFEEMWFQGYWLSGRIAEASTSALPVVGSNHPSRREV